MVYNEVIAVAKGNRDLIKTLKIFANEHRLAILGVLKNKGERSVGQIADSLEISFNTVSKNLLYLAKKGILGKRYDGPFVLYKISNPISEPARFIISRLL